MRRAVGVAYSGGLDSTALLHATLAAAAPLGMDVVALHVQHGLSANAEAWLEHARATCARWARRGRPLTLAWRRLASCPAAGESVEAWARRERYAALRAMAGEAGVGLVLLAQHRRDQAETFLLQALRGAGPSGLAAMSAAACDGSIAWARPWLDRPREAIEAYVRRHRLSFVDDESNRDRRWARSRLRLDVWPALLRAFPDAETSFAAAARLAGDARSVLDAATGSDLQALLDVDRSLDVAALRGLAPERRRHVLVAWLRDVLGHSPPRTLVARLADEVGSARATRWPAPGGRVQRRRARLAYVADGGAEVPHR